MSDQGQLHQRSNDYGKLPAKLMHDDTVTDGAKVLYAHMHWRYGNNHKNFESLASMANELGVSDTTIANRIRELEATNWVVTIERRSAEKGNFISNFYHVFEVQGSARRFRTTYKIQDGETIRPIPEARVKKSRKGKGGKPENLRKDATIPTPIGSTVPTQVGQSTAPTQVGTASPTQVGTIQSQFIQSQEDTEPIIRSVPTPADLISAWLNSVGQWMPMGYKWENCVEDATELLQLDIPVTPDEVRECVLKQTEGRDPKKDYWFSYLKNDIPNMRLKKAAQRPKPVPKELDPFSKFRLEMMQQEREQREKAVS